MARARFERLPEAQRSAILSAAAEEFATHGYHEASLNRIIDAAGISKGSLYYHFDGKEDLFAYVARSELDALLAHAGPLRLPDNPDPDTYWAALTGYYLDVMSALVADPRRAALVRSWVAAAATPALRARQESMEADLAAVMAGLLDLGHRIGAVRTDLPDALLLSVVAGMGQAMDIWLVTDPAGVAELPRTVEALIGMIRRALQP